jgi:hypothetical protein
MWLRYSTKACRPICILERESILKQNGQGSLTCLALPLVAAQSLGSQVLEDFQSHWRLTIAIGNKQLQINK